MNSIFYENNILKKPMKMADKHPDEGINELISGELTESDYDDERNYQEETLNSLEQSQSKVKLRTSRKTRHEASASNDLTATELIDRNKLDSVRFSMYNIQNTQLNEIDALLSELNQLQSTLDHTETDQLNQPTIMLKQQNYPVPNYTMAPISSVNHNEDVETIDHQFDEVLKFLAESINGDKFYETDCNNGNVNYGENSVSPHQSSSSSPSFINSDHGSGSNSSGIGDDFYPNSQNTDCNRIKEVEKFSADSDYMDSISTPSSVKNMTSLTVNDSHPAINSSSNSGMSSEPSPVQKDVDPQQQAEAHKAELIRIALEKLKEANIRKIIVKAYTDDGCTKSVIIDETMKVYDVMLMLFNKNHTRPTVNYSVVEYLPKFHLERVFEDHENLVDAMSNWSRDSENQIIFTEKSDKNDLFLRPELYLMDEITGKFNDSQRSKIVEEFFQNIGSPVPVVEGHLYFKIESKKSWKKYYCVLRQSGLYYIPKGKNKKDLQCLFNFDKLDLYYGIDWRKEYKSPTDFCFALKYPQVQKKSSKYIKYICCETEKDMKRWFNGIRIAKFGKKLLDNYKQVLDLIRIRETTGRLPIVQNRRLSTSVSNNNIQQQQRPRSSYSLASNHNNKEIDINNSNVSNSKRNSLVVNEPIEDTSNKTLLMMKESSNESEEVTQPTVNRTNSSISYTEQLKSLLHAHQIQNQILQQEASKRQSSTTIQASRTPSPQNTGTLKSKPKLPLSTDITKHMINSNPIYQLNNSEEIKQEIFSSNIEFTMAKCEEIPQATSNLILRNQGPSVAPKPVFKRFNSLQNPADSHADSQRPFSLNNNVKKNRSATLTNQPQQPELISELSTILARQKKKIEDAENQLVATKPPTPPRRAHY